MNYSRYIEERLFENKKAFKTYARYEKAEEVAEGVVSRARSIVGPTPLDYMIVYLPQRKRFALVFNLSQCIRNNNAGGYVGWIGDLGHMSF